jgi:hypothetical protein
VNPDQDFGYLLTKEGGLLYFHRNSVRPSLPRRRGALQRGNRRYRTDRHQGAGEGKAVALSRVRRNSERHRGRQGDR